MKHFKYLIIAIFGMVGFSQAEAGGLYTGKETKEVSYSTKWTGAYIGANGSINAPTVNTGGFDYENRNYSLGIHAGFDQLFFGRIVAGVRASYNWAIEDVAALTEAEASWDIIGRAGPLITKNLALYGLVGYGETINKGEDFSNWKVGVGAQYYLTERISIFAEHQWLLADDDFDSVKDATVDGTVFQIGGSIKIGSF